MKNHLHNITDKIYPNAEAISFKIKEWKDAGLNIVFTNGCFDILHKGHVSYLASSADLGDKLIVGLNSDASVQRLNKSPNRPFQDEDSRAHVLASLSFIDGVVIFNEDTPLNLITSILPEVLVKGADYKIEDIVGAQEVLGNGGQVKTIEFINGYSTSAIEQKILNSK
jgi:rfaE bifunctional protein nucleotidyltransferase chain/domain